MTTQMVVNGVEYQVKAPSFQGWQTPPDFFKDLDAEFNFNYDAAASHENALCGRYSTQLGTFGIPEYVSDGQGNHEFAPPDPIMITARDGLEYDWSGLRVFCNPPYNDIGPWIEKALEFEAEVSVLLVPPSTDTGWFHKIQQTGCFNWEDNWRHSYGSLNWYGFRDIGPAGTNVEILFSRGRLRFHHPALKPGFKLKDFKDHGDAIFDYTKPSAPGDSPRAGNMLAIFRR